MFQKVISLFLLTITLYMHVVCYGYGTVDHIFNLKCLIDLYLFGRKKLYCAFVDFCKAFDSVIKQNIIMAKFVTQWYRW